MDKELRYIFPSRENRLHRDVSILFHKADNKIEAVSILTYRCLFGAGLGQRGNGILICPIGVLIPTVLQCGYAHKGDSERGFLAMP